MLQTAISRFCQGLKFVNRQKSRETKHLQLNKAEQFTRVFSLAIAFIESNINNNFLFDQHTFMLTGLLTDTLEYLMIPNPIESILLTQS